MMHKVWSNIEDVPYCFSRSSVKFQDHTRQKSPILTRNGRFRTVTPVWIHPWLWNDAQSLMLYRRCILLFSKVIHQISRSYRTKITNFDPNWAFPDCKFSLNSLMDLKWYTKLDVEKKRCPIIFRGHPSNFKVTRAEKLMIWIKFVQGY